MIERSEMMIETLYNLAEDAESPRVFEVLSTAIKNTSEMMENLIDLQEKRKKLNSQGSSNEPAQGGVVNNTQNNIVFSGDTSTLQRMMKDATEGM